MMERIAWKDPIFSIWSRHI